MMKMYFLLFPASHVSFFRGDIVEKNQGQNCGHGTGTGSGIPEAEPNWSNNVPA